MNRKEFMNLCTEKSYRCHAIKAETSPFPVQKEVNQHETCKQTCWEQVASFYSVLLYDYFLHKKPDVNKYIQDFQTKINAVLQCQISLSNLNCNVNNVWISSSKVSYKSGFLHAVRPFDTVLK